MPRLTVPWRPWSNGLPSRLGAWHPPEHVDLRSAPRRIVVFSDPDALREDGVDGWATAREVLGALNAERVAVVLWGNETRSEMELIQNDLNLHHPFISENGGGLFVHHGYFRERPAAGRDTANYQVFDFGRPYYQVAEALHEVARKVGADVVGFSRMSIYDVAQECDISLSQARLAKLREYDEPFRIIDSEAATYSRICSALRRLSLRCFTHESLHHATGVADKTRSVRTLAAFYRHVSVGSVVTVGLAKERSETCLLKAVDIPIVVERNPIDTVRMGRKVPTARFTSARGPRGWCEAILQLVNGQPDGP